MVCLGINGNQFGAQCDGAISRCAGLGNGRGLEPIAAQQSAELYRRCSDGHVDLVARRHVGSFFRQVAPVAAGQVAEVELRLGWDDLSSRREVET